MAPDSGSLLFEAAEAPRTMLALIPVTCPQERLADRRPGLVTAAAVVGLPAGVDEAMTALASPAQFEPMPDGTLQADLDLPKGVWRYWPAKRLALWIAGTAETPPPVGMIAPLDLFEAALAISDAGLMLRDLKLQDEHGWSKLMRAHRALAALAECPSATAIRGVWSDRNGRAIRAELHSSGAMFASDSTAVARVAEAIAHSLDA